MIFIERTSVFKYIYTNDNMITRRTLSKPLESLEQAWTWLNETIAIKDTWCFLAYSSAVVLEQRSGESVTDSKRLRIGIIWILIHEFLNTDIVSTHIYLKVKIRIDLQIGFILQGNYFLHFRFAAFLLIWLSDLLFVPPLLSVSHHLAPLPFPHPSLFPLSFPLPLSASPYPYPQS